MNKIVLVSSLAVLGMFAGDLHAKSGTIVAGDNGTKWCCPDGKKGDGCEKGASTIPVRKACSFASKSILPAGGLSQDAAPPVAPVQPAKAQGAKKVSTPD